MQNLYEKRSISPTTYKKNKHELNKWVINEKLKLKKS